MFGDTDGDGKDVVKQARCWQRACQDLFSILYLTTIEPAKLLVQKHDGKAGGPENGQAGWEALKAEYARCTKETRCASHEALINTIAEEWQDPDDFFFILDKYAHIVENREAVSDERFEDIVMQGITKDYDYVRYTNYRDPEFGLEEIQAILRRINIDDMSHKGEPTIAG